MRGPVVAVHAIHGAMFSFIQLLLGGLGIGGNEFGGFSVIVGVVDDGDRLAREVGRNVADAGVIGEVVAVNANRTLPGASAHFQQQYVALGCVFFVIFVAGVYQQLVAGKALRPVTLLAGFARRAEACYRRRNGTRIVVERHHEKLPQARDLGPHKPRRSRTDVTFDARHV